jgi:hypothetical protein
MLPLATLAGGLLALSAYKSRVYHPRYFEEVGARTFWHNALMGFCHPQLRERYGTTPGADRNIVELILGQMKKRHDPRLTDAWRVDTALNALGGHNAFDWATYEQVAREVYWRIWAGHPTWALTNYLYFKPASIVWQVRQIAQPSAVGGMDNDADAYRFTPFRMWAFALVLAAVVLVEIGDFRRMAKRYAGVLLFLFPFSLIPSVAFYPFIPTLMGFLMMLTLGVYLGIAWLVVWARGRLASGAVEPSVGRTGGLTAPLASFMRGEEEVCPGN